MKRLGDIFSGIRYKTYGGLSGIDVRGITNDSRKVKKKDLFIASRGYNTDGYAFIGEAIRNGAGTVVAEKNFDAPAGVTKILVKDARAAISEIADNFYGHPSKKLKVIGVTGTNGKTTTTYLMENILKKAGKGCGVIGTINYRIGFREMPAPNTTPGPIELHALFAEMVKKRVRFVVMEVSSHSLEQGRVDRVLFDVAVFTNITKEHLDYHKTMHKYFEAKAELFKKLKRGGIVVLNNDDKLVASLKRRIKNRTLTYGIYEKADVSASDLDLSMDNSLFVLSTPKGSVDIKTKLAGRHNVSNILAAAAASTALGVPLKAIKNGIESFYYVPGRLEPIDSGQPFRVFVDYAHTEDALCNVLSLLKGVTERGKIITVFGCGGNRDRTKRPLMGNVACSLSDRVIVTSDNPRLEDPKRIILEIEAGIKERFSNYSLVEDRREAIGMALRAASKGDVVLIAGKGHEKYQIIKENAIPFDDCEVARSILCKLGK